MANDKGKARAERYRALAAEAYSIADQMADAESRLIMRQLALTYDRLAMEVEDWGQQQSAVPTFVSDKE